MFKSNKNISEIAGIDSLCTGCGVCIGICPHNAITKRVDNIKGLLRPSVDEKKCKYCKKCINVCPALDFEIENNTKQKDIKKYHQWIGYFVNTYIGYALDNEILSNASSGGMVISICKYLLENKYVDCVALSRIGDGNNAFKTKTELVSNTKELLKYQRSIYAPVMVGEILSSIRKIEGTVAIVGLPCHIAGITKAINNDRILKNKIKFLIGLFCSRTPTMNATFSLLKDLKIKKEDVQKIEYRSGGWPSKMIITTNDKKFIVPHLSYNYWGLRFKKFFMPIRCYLCNDKSSALADISFGDNWTEFKPKYFSSSSIITRSILSEQLIYIMRDKGLIYIDKINAEHLSESQNFHIKNDVNHRALLWKIFGKTQMPNYKINYSMFEIIKSIRSLTTFFRVKISNKNLYLTEKIYRLYVYKEDCMMKLKKILKLAKFILKFFIIKQKKLEKNKKYKIAIIGGYGSKDIGDEAMPQSIIKTFREKLGDDLDIIMFSPNPEYTEKYHKERSEKDITYILLSHSNNYLEKIKNLFKFLLGLSFIFGVYLQSKGIRLFLWKDARLFLDELYTSDVLFNVGGGNLNSIIRFELYKKAFTYWAASILKKPIIISGQTVGPFTKKIDELFLRFALNKVDLITFRDNNISMDRVKGIGVKKPLLINTADDAVNLPNLDEKNSKKILFKEVGNNWLDIENDFVVAMNMKGSMSIFQEAGLRFELTKEIELLANVADYLVDNYSAKIIFIPTDYCDDVDDRIFHKLIYKKVKHKQMIRCIEGEYDAITLKGIIGLTDLAIGARYHFCVFAATMFVPFLGIASGIYQRTKLKGLVELCGISELYIDKDMKDLTVEEVSKRIESILEKKEIIKKQLLTVVPKLQKNSLFSIEYAIEKLTK